MVHSGWVSYQAVFEAILQIRGKIKKNPFITFQNKCMLHFEKHNWIEITANQHMYSQLLPSAQTWSINVTHEREADKVGRGNIPSP